MDEKITKCPPGYAIGYVPQNRPTEIEEFCKDFSHLNVMNKKSSRELRREWVKGK